MIYLTSTGLRRYYREVTIDQNSAQTVDFTMPGFIVVPVSFVVINNDVGSAVTNCRLNNNVLGDLTDTFAVNQQETAAPLLVPLSDTVMRQSANNLSFLFAGIGGYTGGLFVDLTFKIYPA